MNQTTRLICGLSAGLLLGNGGIFGAEAPAPRPLVLKAASFRQYTEGFNRDDEELYRQHIPNAGAWDWMQRNVPLFECPDHEIELTYFFRWWTYRKHLRQTPEGFVVTEFLPNVPWAGKFNTISCPAGHHFYEGRWIADPQYLQDYATFWFRKGGEPRRYSFWAADALWANHLVQPNAPLLTNLLPDLVANFEAWEKTQRDANGLFWQIDDRDGMEVSVGGSGCRATINSYMFGDALAIARIAEMAERKDLADRFRGEAARLKKLVQDKLWDGPAEFFKVLPRGANASSGGCARAAWIHAVVFQPAGRAVRCRVETAHGPARFLRAVRADDHGAAASRLQSGLRRATSASGTGRAGRIRRRSR